MTDFSKSGKPTTLSSFYILGVTFTVNPSLLAPPEELSPTQEYLPKSASSFTVMFMMCSVAITLSPEKKQSKTNKQIKQKLQLLYNYAAGSQQRPRAHLVIFKSLCLHLHARKHGKMVFVHTYNHYRIGFHCPVRLDADNFPYVFACRLLQRFQNDFSVYPFTLTTMRFRKDASVKNLHFGKSYQISLRL